MYGNFGLMNVQANDMIRIEKLNNLKTSNQYRAV